jgi:hypothetical protein
MRLVKVILPIATLLACSLSRCPGAEDQALKAEEQILRAAGIAADGPAVLDLFRRHTLSPASLQRITSLIGQLGDDQFELREKASRELASFGSAAGPLLRRAQASADVEVVRRAEQLLKQVDAGPGPKVFAAAAHVLAARKPDGAAAALLAFLPFAEEVVQAEARAALAALALRDGKPEQVLVKALKDAVPLRRSAAGEALCGARAPGVDAELRALLKDPDPEVRLRIALAFLALNDREAVPVLIALLGELPAPQLWQVEDALYRLAGQQAPDLTTLKDPAPATVRKLWNDWWQAHGSGLDLARVSREPALLGYTLIATVGVGTRHGGQVLELGRDGKRRWLLDGIVYPLDVQVLTPNRLLVAENTGNRVTERDLAGKVLWEKQIPLPISCERLAGGTTLIANSSQIVEVDRSGKEVFSYQLPKTKGKIIAARKLKNGQILYVTNPGGVTRLDPDGRVLKSFPIGKVSYFASTVDILPNGRILIPLYIDDRVVEYDPEGRAVWQAKVTGPVSAIRLPNGNTLVALPVPKKVVELDRAGKAVGQTTLDGQPRQARRR